MEEKSDSYWNRMERKFLAPHVWESDLLTLWRERILFAMCFVASVTGPVALVPSLILSIHEKLWHVVVLDIVAYGTALFLLFSSKSVALRTRAWVAFFMLYSLGVGLLFMLGFNGAGYIWLFGASVLIGGITGMSTAMWTLFLNFLSLILVGAYIYFGTPEWASRVANPLQKWSVMAVNFMLLNALVTISATLMLEGLKNVLAKEQKTSESLRVSRKRYKSLLETIPYGIQEIGADGRISFINESYQRIIGYTPEEIYKTHVWDHMTSPQEKKQVQKSFQYALDNVIEPTAYQCQVFRADGKIIDIHLDWDYLYDDHGNLEGVISVLTDITEKRDAEKIRVDLEERLKQAQKMESIGTLAGGIAHDFNNILNSIIGFSELSLDDSVPGSQQEEFLNEILKSSSRAADLVRQILTFARRGADEAKPVRVGAIATETMKLLRSTLPTSIKIRQSIRTESLVIADPTQIHQVFLNLCTNAAQAMEEHGGTLEISLEDVALGKEDTLSAPGLKQGNYVRIKVADTGMGIPEEVVDSIFDPYFTTKGVGQGTGLGLAVVHGIVQNCGGEIMVNSSMGKGTVFTILLPQALGKVSGDQPRKQEEAPKGAESVLFVDDEASIVKMGKRMLERLGYSVTTCTSSTKALKMVRNSPFGFDVVITDMTMPDMTGDVLATEVMKINPAMPVILCTGFSNRISEEKAMSLGIAAYATKPLSKDTLAKTLRDVLDFNRTDSQAG